MEKNDIYASDPELTKEVERSLKKTLSNRSIGEGLLTGTYLTLTYHSAAGLAKAVENIQNHNTSIEMGNAGLAVTSALTAASVFGAVTSAHAARNLDTKRFALGAASIPLLAVWLNSTSPEPNTLENPYKIQDTNTIQITDPNPQYKDIKLEIEPQ